MYCEVAGVSLNFQKWEMGEEFDGGFSQIYDGV